MMGMKKGTWGVLSRSIQIFLRLFGRAAFSVLSLATASLRRASLDSSWSTKIAILLACVFPEFPTSNFVSRIDDSSTRLYIGYSLALITATADLSHAECEAHELQWYERSM